MTAPTVLLILIAIFLLLAGTAVFLFLVIRRSRKISFTAAKAEPEKKESSGTEFLQFTSDLELRTSFRRALRTLKTYVTGRDYRYRAPWYVLAGESKSGKTSLLESNGLDIPVNELIEKNRRLNWYCFDQGVVIDVAGDFVLRSDGTANHRGWNTILRLLQKHRPQRPLDGLVLTIPCTDLTVEGELDHERRNRLEQKAICLYKKLWQAQKILGMRLPVYLLVTKCDEITGFTSFCRQLPEKLRTQMFGWSNPASLETAYKPELLSEAFASLHKHLSWLQFEIYAERDEIEDVDDLFLFPTAVQSMSESLGVYLDCLFKQSAYHESYLFRGLYFCGEPGVDALTDTEVLPEIIQPPEKLEALQPTALQRKPVFLTDLFRKKIFSEATLAQPIRRIALSRNRTALTAQVLSLLIVLVGGGGLAVSYNRMAQQEEEVYRFLADEQRDLQTIETYRMERKRSGATDTTEEWLNRRQQLLQSGETRLLTGMANLNARRFGSWLIPSSWFSGVNTRLENSIAAVFKFVIFESLRVDMQQRAKSLLSAHPEHLTNAAEEADSNANDPAEETAGSDTHVTPDFQLSLYVQELGDFRVNLEHYNRLVGKDPDSVNTLRQLVTYLDHSPIPAGFDKNNYLYQHAMFTAQGRPIDSARFYKESANRVGDLVEDFYAASFNQKGVTYDHLNDIAETEALLSRPEYTWLSTYVFDPHSPFHGMTLSSGLGELRKALQDLRREEFMSRDAAEELSLALPPEPIRYQHLVRRVLIWDQDALKQAIALHDQYENFVETKSYERTEYLNNSVRQAAKTRLKTRMSRLFREARKYQAAAPVAEGSALRASLIAEIQSLQEAQPSLARALQISARLGIDSELRGALSVQVSYLLRGIYREFASQRFYSMKRTDFAWWNGSQPISFLAYDLSSVEDLTGYLALQRKNIAFLARDLAVPLLTFSASQNIYTQSNVSFDWNEILTDLDAFENKLPGNPISSLESFIVTDMDRVSIDSCSSTLNLTSDSSRDYFLRIRNSMRAQFYRRCNELARIKAVNDTLFALENYGEIGDAFNKSLAGGFPFTDLSTRPNYPDLDPWEMLKFFRLFDSKEKAARAALARSADFGAAPQSAAEFLDQVAAVREFFAPFLEKKQGPMFDFRLQFRVNQEQEIGANQIIDWKFEVGKKKFAYLSDDVEGRWIFGDPVRLTLRWANNSPVLPVTSATPASVKAKDRIAVFEYNDRWSLFSFLLKHGVMLKRAGTPAECDQGFDAEPYTLKFTVRTDPDPAGQPVQHSELKGSNAEVFMRISLVTANKQEPLMLPCFPRKAPPIPRLPVVIERSE
ncbi:MAG TPA: type VI secretion protein IcmF/TssM N-terminal domain-containing protein [Pyrinomonadaceae bacterium]|nr:type VI secretion protein IcmF/TssM N-terminal domain-containing protein [Pyrinomonadaceae bacterium]